MMSNLVSKLSGLFDARFALSYLAPASAGAVAIAVIAALESGVGRVLAAWQELRTGTTVSGGVAVVLALVLIAYLLQSATTPLLQLWEGRYLPGRLARRYRDAQARAAARVAAEMEQLDRKAPHAHRYFGFPRDPRRLRPTRLGNALAAAEEYPREVYGLDGVLWWPRLLAVLPDRMRAQIDDALTPIVGLLNLGTVLALSALGASLVLLIRESLVPFWLPALIGLAVAWLCYQGAVSHAVSFGTLIRVAFDYHRLDILRGMSIRTPESYEEERALWQHLNQWVHAFTPPGEGSGPSDPEWMRSPFTYAASDSDA